MMMKLMKCGKLAKGLLEISTRSISASAVQHKHSERKQWGLTTQYRDEGVQGIGLVSLETDYETRFREFCNFPELGLEQQSFEGQLFSEIPILEMTTHKNNTKLACFDQNYSKMIDYTSGGTEGFKNCKKGTTVAAHAAGYAIGKKLLLKGHRQVRLAVKGIGAGRKASIQGMVAAGLKIITITDITNYAPIPRLRRKKPQRK